MTFLTPHVTLEQLTRVGPHKDINNTPPPELAGNAVKLAKKIEQAILIFNQAVGHDCPLTISYGYRCPALNLAAGGSETSAHCDFLAVDLIPADLTLRQGWDALRKDPSFCADIDQLIIERGCIHFGLPTARHGFVPRHELRLDADVKQPDGSIKRTYPLFGLWTAAGATHVES